MNCFSNIGAAPHVIDWLIFHALKQNACTVQPKMMLSMHSLISILTVLV